MRWYTGASSSNSNISKSTPVLMTYGQVGLPPGSLVDGEIRDMTSVSEAIQKLWKNGQFTGSSVIVGIAGLRASTREIDLPYVPDDEVDSAVRSSDSPSTACPAMKCTDVPPRTGDDE